MILPLALTLTVTLAGPLPAIVNVPVNIDGTQTVTDANVTVPLETPIGPGVTRCSDLAAQLSRNPLVKSAVCQ